MANKYHSRYFSDRDDGLVLASPVPLLHGKHAIPRSCNLSKPYHYSGTRLKKSTQTPGFGSNSASAIQDGQIEPKEPQSNFEISSTTEALKVYHTRCWQSNIIA